MAGVKDFIALETKELNINDIIEIVISPNCGAVSTFIGTTRDHFHQKQVYIK
jgi:molybdopterin synthase catalytic subunit